MPVLARKERKAAPPWRVGLSAYLLGASLDVAADLAEANHEPVWSVLADLEAAPFWAAYEDRLLRDWLREHPGMRPPGWWLYSAQPVEPRQVVRGGWQLLPSRSRWHRDGRPFGHPAEWGQAWFESQASYLRRHGLFLRGEERRLSPDAFEPLGWQEEPLT